MQTRRLRRPWSDADVTYLRTYGSRMKTNAIAAVLDRPASSVHVKMSELGIRSLRAPLPAPSVAKIHEYITEALTDGLTVEDVLRVGRRNRSIASIRWRVISRLLAEGYGKTAIAKRLGLDHTSICHASRAMDRGKMPWSGGGDGPRKTVLTPRLIPYAGFDQSERQLKAA